MIPGLDGIRAVAFLLIFILHTDYFYFGWVGVQLFFVLSGFLITDILLRMKEKFPAGPFFAKFYGRRFLRIFPLYYFYLALMFGITTALIAVGYKAGYMHRFQAHLPYAITYLYNFFNASSLHDADSWLIGHFWSLSVEEQFYIIWPLLIFLTPQKHLKKLFLAVILLGPVFRLLITFLYRQSFPLLSDNMPVAVYVLPFSHLDAFAFGAYASRFKFPRPKLQLLLLLAFIPLTGFATQYIFTGDVGVISALGFPYPLANGFKQIWGYSLLDYFFAILIFSVVNEGLFIRILETRFMRYLGKISYGLYVYHFPVIWFVARIRDLGVSDEAIAKPLTLLISFPLTLLIASLSYRYIEQPILELKDRWFSLRARQPD
jgi:peptidoglycan/LPS O-acetylase OafA/YrhL